MRLRLHASRALLGRTPPWRHLAVTGILVLILALVSAMTIQGWRSARRQDAVAHRALGDRAAYAAASYRARLGDELYLAAATVFRPVWATVGSPSHSAPIDPAVLHRTAEAALRCRCVLVIAGHSYFRLDVGRTGARVPDRGGALAMDPDGADHDDLARRADLVRIVSAHARTRYKPDWQFAIVVDSSSRSRPMVIYTIVRSSTGQPLYAYGFRTDTTALRKAIFDNVLRYTELVPHEGGRLEPVNALLSIGILGPRGQSLYGSRPAYPTVYTARRPLDDFMDSIVVEASLNPATALPTLLGGNERSPLPMLAILLVLTTSLLFVALVLSWRAAELTRLRSDFTSSVSHELRTPLTQMLLYAETLALGRARSSGEAREIGEVVVRETRRLIHLVENTLQFERTERRLLTIRTVTQPVAPLIRDIVRDFEELVAPENVEICASLEEGTEVAVDADALRQIVVNLLDNAVRYGPPRQTLRVGLHSVDGALRLSVTDQGPGIRRQDRERVWRPYVRLPSVLADGTTGTGIGLAIVRELATLHGGSVGISDAAAGTCVFVDFPLGRRGRNGSGSRNCAASVTPTTARAT